MALTQCLDCGHQISEQAEACPKCGWEANPRRKSGATAALRAGPYLANTRSIHWAAVGGYAMVGFVSMFDVEALNSAANLAAVAAAAYCLVLIVSRAANLRTMSASERRTCCFDLIELTIYVFMGSVIAGFWWGFGGALDGPVSVMKMLSDHAVLFGATASIGFAFTIAAALVTWGTTEVQR